MLRDTSANHQAMTMDNGSLVSVSIPEQAHTVQDCIDAWHAQPYVHALTAKPHFLVIVLARYSDLDRGKNTQRIACHPDATISMPVFGASLATVWHRCAMIGGVNHFGPSPQAGHYRAFAVQRSVSQAEAAHSESAPSRGTANEMWQFDDGVVAMRCSPEEITSFESNCYMLCYRTI